jgi:uncharacterized lipoprotein YddW (UPF0748 family)
MSKLFIIIFTLISFIILVKGEFDYNESYYTYNCKELYKQKEALEQQVYTSDNIRQLYKEISQMIYQLCYNDL